MGSGTTAFGCVLVYVSVFITHWTGWVVLAIGAALIIRDCFDD